MRLNHVGETKMSKRGRDAVGAVVQEGKVRTYDMLRVPGGAKAIGRGAATTSQLTDEIISKLG
jgi:3-isopropylmalate dehydrogenase